MIKAVLQDPTIDKLNFMCDPGTFGVARNALDRFTVRTTTVPGENERTGYYYNNSDTHLHVAIKDGRLFVDSNPNNIDPAELSAGLKGIGIELPDVYSWLMRRADIERHQQMPMPAANYTPVLFSSLSPRLQPKGIIQDSTFTVLSSGCELQFYDKTAERKARRKAIDIPNVCRMEVRYLSPAALRKIGVQTAGELLSIGADGLLRIYSNQVEKLLPSLRVFAGDQPGTELQQSALDKAVNVFLSLHADPERRGNIVAAAERVLFSLLIARPGAYFDYSLFHKAYSIYSNTVNLDRRQRSKDRKRIDELISLKNKYEDETTYMQQTARELLTYVA